MRRKKAEDSPNEPTALAVASELLATRGKKLTALRRATLKLLCQEQDKAIGAYALMSALSKELGRRIAPETVYRTLRVLEKHGLVAHLLSSRAYVACSSFCDDKAPVFFVCSRCGRIAESGDPLAAQAISSSASAIGFVLPGRIIDLAGLCKHCARASKVHQPIAQGHAIATNASSSSTNPRLKETRFIKTKRRRKTAHADQSGRSRA